MSRKLTTEKIKDRFKSVHGNRYDYSKVKYIKGHINVEIICSKHGSFWQSPVNHMSGQGCPKCGIDRSTEARTSNACEFIEKANPIHNFKYDYNKVIYKTSHKNVEIICPTHGSFWQKPRDHLKGAGCPKCGRNKIIESRISNTKEFIGKADIKHDFKYDYSKVIYIKSREKVEIICLEHGSFWQTPNDHLSGCGCPKCGIDKIIKARASNRDEFIFQAQKIPGNKQHYNYDEVEYKGSLIKVKIICNIHQKSFWQTPGCHLQGVGCPDCGGTQQSNTEEFIEKVNPIHGFKYDYNKVVYKTAKQKIEIICPKHGSFWQTPHSHLRGKGFQQLTLK